jgi:condensin complex subunit 3
MLCKKYEAKLAGFSEEEFRKLEELKDLFEFLDDIVPDDDVDEVLEGRRGGGRKRYVCLVSERHALLMHDARG